MELARLVTEQVEGPAIIPQERQYAFGNSTTINMAIEGWKQNGWQDLSPSTTRRYTSIWTTHIKNSIGRRTIATLGPYDVELYLPRPQGIRAFRGQREANESNPAQGVSTGTKVEWERTSQSGIGHRDARLDPSRTG